MLACLRIIKIEMKGGLNKIMRNITATASSKTEFEKVGRLTFLTASIEADKGDVPHGF
jgi:hypothetical protein